MLGISNRWRDYGTDSAVADFEMECDLPKQVSRIVLDPERPYGFFYFAPGRWRFIYRINESENRQEAITESAVNDLLLSRLPGAKINQFLWASAFRLGQGQCHTYRQGRWFLCGDAAHAMGPSAGAGMMVGVLGAGVSAGGCAGQQERPACAGLLDEYEREQRVASEEVQRANAAIFRNIGLPTRSRGGHDPLALRSLSRVGPVVRLRRAASAWGGSTTARPRTPGSSPSAPTGPA
jgi:2-polyprenyl-6-methoxyphenol hydroxylase-like FAD-dependent oxidoreductase